MIIGEGNTGLGGGRVVYTDIIKIDGANHTMLTALQYVVNELYGCAPSLSGNSQWKRFCPSGKQGNHGYAGEISPCMGVVGRWDTDERYLVVLTDDHLDEQERVKRKRRSMMLASRQKREQRRLLRLKNEKAAEEAKCLWAQTAPGLPCHGYLRRKGLSAEGVKQLNKKILVPLFDGEELVNIQFIDELGNKRFLAGGKKKGCFHSIGDLLSGNEVLMCEGWATGRSLHAGTGVPVVCAMDAGNLSPVAQRLRKLLPPRIQITIAADDDRQREDNPGLRHARAAAWSVGGAVVRPEFCPLCDSCTDFNDVAVCAARGDVPHDF